MSLGPLCDRKFSAVHFRLAHRLRLGAVGLHIVAEHLAHAGDICAASSQECRRLKRPHACPVHEVSRIDHNAPHTGSPPLRTGS